MPSTCTLITIPMTRSSAPPCCMCSGVITITATIAAWAPDRPTTAASSTGRSRTAATTRPHEVPDTTPVAASPARLRASRSGSGRIRSQMTRAASSMPTLPMANGPVSSGIPSPSATVAESPVRLGPTTAPIVVAHTTVESARARVCALARSVAA